MTLWYVEVHKIMTDDIEASSFEEACKKIKEKYPGCEIASVKRR